MRLCRHFVFAATAVFFTVAAAQAAKRPVIAIENVTVIDTVAGRGVGPRTVLVVGGRIAAIDEPPAVQIPRAATRVDGRGLYLIPGLVDMHVHLFNNATRRPPNEWAFPLFVVNGVTAVREMRTEPAQMPTVKRWREQVARGELIAPHVLAAGVAVRGNSEDEARRQVRAAHVAGADFIKVFSEVPAAHWRALLDQARALGMPVCGHVPAEVSLLEAARAGQGSDEHLTQAYEACSSREEELLAARQGVTGDDLVKLRDAQEPQVLESFDQQLCDRAMAALAETNQVQVPTLVLAHFEARGAPSNFRGDPRWRLLRADEQARWERILEQTAADDKVLATGRRDVSCKIVGALRAAGVRILAGTDAPMPLVYPGFALHDELELLVECGLSPAEALRAATIAPAEFLGQAESRGSVAVGKRADLVLLEADPLRQIGNVRRIRAVVLDGRLLRRADLDSLLRAAGGATP